MQKSYQSNAPRPTKMTEQKVDKQKGRTANIGFA
jgi:hypothetical protein